MGQNQLDFWLFKTEHMYFEYNIEIGTTKNVVRMSQNIDFESPTLALFDSTTVNHFINKVRKF